MKRFDRPHMHRTPFVLTGIIAALMLGACSSVTIDEYQRSATDLEAHESIVLLGRRHSPDYETEPDLVDCVGKIISSNNSGIEVIGERQFVDQLYPWFEPRMAPLKPERLMQLRSNKALQARVTQMNIRYMVWIDGQTETTNSKGSIGCAIGPGGGGCFGFGSWDDESDYEASVWDYQQQKLVAKVSADAKGTSYMPAIILPIPMLARVQANACKGLGSQLRQIFNNETATPSNGG